MAQAQMFSEPIGHCFLSSPWSTDKQHAMHVWTMLNRSYRHELKSWNVEIFSLVSWRILHKSNKKCFSLTSFTRIRSKIYFHSLLNGNNGNTVASPISGRSSDAISDAQRAEHEVGCMIQWAPCHSFTQHRGDRARLCNFERFPLLTLHRHISHPDMKK